MIRKTSRVELWLFRNRARAIGLISEIAHIRLKTKTRERSEWAFGFETNMRYFYYISAPSFSPVPAPRSQSTSPLPHTSLAAADKQMAHSEQQNDTDSRKRPWSRALEDSEGREQEELGQPANPKSQRVSEGHGQAQAAPSAAGAADDGVAVGAPLTANEPCALGLEKALQAVHDVLGRVADADQKAWCYNRILSGLRVARADGGAGATEEAAPPPPAAAVTAAAALRTCKVYGAVFTFAHALAKFRALLLMPVCIKYMDGRSLALKVPRLGSVSDLRAAVAARTEVAATTVGLFVTGRDGEELRDNQLLVDVVGRNAGANAGTAFALGRDACWTCTACFCTSGRSVEACVDCQLPRPSTEDQSAELRAAAEAGSLEDVLALVAAAAPVDAPEAGGHRRTALFIASQRGHLAVAEALLAAGADKDTAKDNGVTALFIASQNGHLAVVQALLAAGADKDTANDNGATALVIASQQGHLAVAEALLAAGAEKEAKAQGGFTALYVASEQGHLAVAQALLAAGADKDAAMDNGTTALYMASEKGHLAVAEALLAAGADKEAKERTSEDYQVPG